MVLAIMQPYFLPYIGYWQLLNAVDVFVVYDDVEYTKKGWINRNRILISGKDRLFSLPLKKDSDYIFVDGRRLTDSFEKEKLKILRKIKAAYRKAPFFEKIFPVIENCFNYKDKNLFRFINNSIITIKEYLDINTKILISSKICDYTKLKGQDRVIATCLNLGAKKYINPIGGVKLYDHKFFLQKGIKLNFLKPRLVTYKQFDHQFIPWLSIIDILMFNSQFRVKGMLNEFDLV